MQLSLIQYSYNKAENDFTKLENLLIDIRFLNEIKSGIWDTSINYRSSRDKNVTNLNPNYYFDRYNWVDFIFESESYSIDDLIS